MDFTGVPQKTMTYHKRRNADAELVVKEDFVYDNQNRLTVHTHKVNSDAPVTLAKNKYNEIGQLTEKEVGGDQNGNSPLQTVSYAYNIRGWMTGINSGDILYNPSDGSYLLTGGKLFGYNIRYNNPVTPSLGAAKYNGNIAEVDWISKDVSLKRYGYQYDGLNRLLRGNYQDPGRALPETHINDETLTYDLNGNIKTLVRNSKHDKQYTPIVVDNLGYQYTGNRVTNITDGSGNSSGYEGGGQNIPYDVNGNMTAMPDKGISAIAYNFLNLPTQINQNVNVTNYFYRADGVKVKKKFVLTNSAGTKIINTEYLDGFQYSTPNTEPIRKALETKDDATMDVATAGEEEAFSKDEDKRIAIIDTGNPPVVDNMILSFFPTSEGFYDYENFRYIYQYKDHLGNVRVSYVKNSAGDLEIRDRNDYYPFGMSFLKPFGQVSVYDPMAIPYNYKYQGQELQETGFYSFKWRNYDPSIGRFLSIDPLSEKFPYNSTYAFQENKLGMGREFEGLELVPFEFLITSNSAIEPVIPLAEAGIREIPIEPVVITASRATPPSAPGFWEKIGNWFDSVFDSSSESTAPRSMDKTVENIKPESTAESATETGKIYRVPGEQTESGKPYVGRTKQSSPAQRGRGANDGRNRGGDTEVVDKYDPKNPGEGAYKEQKAIDKEGGIKNLDNKRNEVSPKRMKELDNTYGDNKHR